MKRLWWRRLLRIIALAVCIIPPVKVTIGYIPLWLGTENGIEGFTGMIIPGFAVIVFLFCAIPLFKYIFSKLKTPSAWLIWSVMWVLSELIAKIINEMRVITFVGAICNIVGLILWKISYIGMGGSRK
jgi:hypothetical protein